MADDLTFQNQWGSMSEKSEACMRQFWDSISATGQRTAIAIFAAILGLFVFFLGWVFWDVIARKWHEVEIIAIDDTKGPTLGDLGEDALRIQKYVKCLKNTIPIEDRKKRLQEAALCEEI